MDAKQLFEQVNTYFGFKIPLLQFKIFEYWYQEFQHDPVVCGFGLLDPKRTHLYDTIGVMIQAAILLKKQTYVYDEETEQWYVARPKTKKGKTWSRFVRCLPPPHPFFYFCARDIKPSTQAYVKKVIGR